MLVYFHSAVQLHYILEVGISICHVRYFYTGFLFNVVWTMVIKKKKLMVISNV